MGGYTKLFSSIVTSTIWCEDAPTRIVWVAMLALKDRDGRVDGSIPGFARVANVTVEEMERAIRVLSSPDPHSRTPDNEGRRIEAVPGGWRVLNHETYRALESEEHRREMDAKRAKEYRDRHAASRSVTPRHVETVTNHAASRHSDTDTDAVQASPKPGEAGPAPFLAGDGAEQPPLSDTKAGSGVTKCIQSAFHAKQAAQGAPKGGGAAPEIPRNSGKAGSVRLETKSPTPVQQVVLGFKFRLGIPDDDRDWDKLYFSRYSASAKSLLTLFAGDVGRCLDAIDAVADACKAKRLSWTPETVVTHAGEFKAHGKVFQ